jgi:type I restriction enzyme, S subunit
MPTKLQKYDNYKPSGLDWLGDIPAGWEVRRVKDCGKSVLGKMLDNESSGAKYLKPYLKSKNIQWQNIALDQVEEMYFTQNDLKNYRINKNDLLLSEGGEVGKTSIWNNELEECYIQNSVHKITINSLNNYKYFFYQSFVLGSSEYYNSIVSAISIRHLTKEKLINIKVLQPPLRVQTIIANYLDTQTATIDKEIDFLTAKVTKYKQLKQILISETVSKGLDKSTKLKPSGVEWIGNIPQEWEVRRLEDIIDLLNGYAFKSKSNIDHGINVIKMSNLKSGTVEVPQHNQKAEEKVSLKKFLLKENDILLGLSGSLENFAKIEKSDLPLYLNQRVCSIKSNIKSKNQFLFWLIQSNLFKDQVGLFSSGTTITNLSTTVLQKFRIPNPPLQIQQQIADYLDEQTGKIDLIITTINTKITKLKVYRKVLINDVVTGRVRVEN